MFPMYLFLQALQVLRICIDARVENIMVIPLGCWHYKIPKSTLVFCFCTDVLNHYCAQVLHLDYPEIQVLSISEKKM